MAFYDGLGKRIQQTGQEAIDRTKKSAEVARLNSSINGLEKEMAKKYEELGRAYYDKNAAKGTYDPDMGAYFQDLDDKLGQIQKYKDQILVLKGYRKCPVCGQDVSVSAAYCNYCGAKLEPMDTTPEQVETSERVCPNCGAVLEDDQIFCTVCGTKVEDVAPAEEEPAQRTCPNCGAPVDEGDIFCNNCGQKIG